MIGAKGGTRGGEGGGGGGSGEHGRRWVRVCAHLGRLGLGHNLRARMRRGLSRARGGAREGTACGCVSVRTGPAWSSCLFIFIVGLVVICGAERLAQRGNIMDGGSAGCVRGQKSGLMSLWPACVVGGLVVWEVQVFGAQPSRRRC